MKESRGGQTEIFEERCDRGGALGGETQCRDANRSGGQRVARFGDRFDSDGLRGRRSQNGRLHGQDGKKSRQDRSRQPPDVYVDSDRHHYKYQARLRSLTSSGRAGRGKGPPPNRRNRTRTFRFRSFQHPRTHEAFGRTARDRFEAGRGKPGRYNFAQELLQVTILEKVMR